MSNAVAPIFVFQGRFRKEEVLNGSGSCGAFSGRRVRVPVSMSPWVQELEGRFNELTSLQFGWDGYRGQPVSFTNARYAAQLLEAICIPTLSAPSLVPGNDGTLQIEWHEHGYDVEIDVLAPLNVVASRYVHGADEGEEIELSNDFSDLVQWMIALDEVQKLNNLQTA